MNEAEREAAIKNFPKGEGEWSIYALLAAQVDSLAARCRALDERIAALETKARVP